ncbi:hypothetical protein [Nonomuraea rubra]|uniref:hypothetical protein n=1 Tax=Nonomuraea rubra TaxID=46180 RepID=UPI0033F6E9DD
MTLNAALTCDDGQGSQLISAAWKLIAARYIVERHQIGAAVLDRDGGVHVGLHLDAMVGRAAVCAEAVALGVARMATNAPLVMVAAVRHPKPSETAPARLVPPCGLCRELLLDHAPDMTVVVPGPRGGSVMPLAHLLPHKYVGSKWASSHVRS